MNEHGYVAADELLAGIAVHLTEGRVGGDDGAIQRVDDHAVAGGIEDGAMLEFEPLVG